MNLNILRGSSKNPFSYFRIIPIILLGFILFGFFYFNKNSNNSSLSKNQLKSEQNFYLNSQKNFWIESPDFFLIQKNSLVGISPPIIINPQVLGTLVGESESKENRKIIIEYIIEPEDTLFSIANKFGISLDTLLWANNLNKKSLILAGEKLIIPPVSGVIHYVQSGDTVSKIAKKYKSKIEEILAFNDLSFEENIYMGDIIIVPNGIMPSPTKSISSTPFPSSSLIPLASSYFICPVSPCKISQGLHWHNAVDFDGQCSQPIFAPAAGKVLKVKLTNLTSSSVFGGLGNHLTILHSNGIVTIYGHLLISLVEPNEEISQGQIIALIGGQPGSPGAGRSTGCHLHFSVSGSKNPFAK